MNLILNTFQQLVLSNPCVKKKPMYISARWWMIWHAVKAIDRCLSKQDLWCHAVKSAQVTHNYYQTNKVILKLFKRAFFSIIVLLTPLQSQTSYVHVILVLVFNYKHLTKCVQWSGFSIRSEFANTWWLSWVINTSLNISIDPI